MREDTLFGEIAIRLSTHPENIATESLRYIFERHAAAWPAVARFLELSDIFLPEALVFNTQSVGEDASIPDLTGTDATGAEVFLLEAKFWAGLTPNQPVAYLRRLPQHRQSALCFVAPALRLETLWPKLVSACEEAFPILEHPEASTDFRVARISEHHTLALLTWRTLLSVIEREASAHNDRDLLEDVDQLSGLCTRMDGNAFLPLQGDDLSPEIGRRVQQYAELVDSTVFELVNRYGAETKNLSTGGSKSDYGRFFYLDDLGCFLGYRPSLWGTHWETPIWLTVTEKDWKDTPRIYDLLSRAFASKNVRAFRYEGRATIPIELPVGVEKSDVQSAIVRQVKEIVQIAKPDKAI